MLVLRGATKTVNDYIYNILYNSVSYDERKSNFQIGGLGLQLITGVLSADHICKVIHM